MPSPVFFLILFDLCDFRLNYHLGAKFEAGTLSTQFWRTPLAKPANLEGKLEAVAFIDPV